MQLTAAGHYQSGRRPGHRAPGDGDLALYDGDPLETTTHCTAVIIDGKVVSEVKR
jgi:hypothetical protein